MLNRLILTVCVAIALTCGVALVGSQAWGEGAATNSPAPAVQAPVVSANPAFSPEEAELDAKIRDIMTKMFKLNAQLRDARDRALKQDDELRAIQDEITVKQAAQEKRLLEKYPEIAKLTETKDALMKEHRAANSQLFEMRRAKAGEKGP